MTSYDLDVARARAWIWFARVGAVLVVAVVLLPQGLTRDVLYGVVGLAPVVAIAVGLRLHRPSPRLPWLLMIAGQLLWVAGDGYYSYIDLVRPDASYLPGDLAYLAAYPLFAAALLLLVMGRLASRRDLPGLLDTATVVAGMALLAWVILGRQAVADQASSGLIGVLVAVGYPLGDILLAGGVFRLVFLSGARKPALRFLLIASTLLVVADIIYALSPQEDNGTAAALAALMWLSSYVFWGLAGLHPSMQLVARPTSGADTRFTRPRLAAAAVATLSAPAVLAAEAITGHELDVWPVVVGSVTMFSLVVARMYVTIQEVTEANRQRQRLEQELVHRAAHDALTGLPNRAQLMLTLDASMSRSRRTGSVIALLFVDLDGFKSVNDTFGHRAGDTVLRVLADRLQQQIRTGDTVARLGGDEFVVLLEPVETEAAAVVVADRLIEAASRSIDLGRLGSAKIGASIGVALSRDSETSAESFLHEADTAAYRAKTGGKGRYEVYDVALRQELAVRADLTDALAHAAERGQLVLHYQPIVDLGTGEVESYEALLRWDRPGHGLLPPSAFIPVAETTDLVCELDSWALQRAATDFAGIPTTDGIHPRVAVNVSGRHLARSRVVEDVALALHRSRLPASRLVVELTETVLVDDALVLQHLAILRNGGVAVSIDDFGTGYRTIAQLGTLPMDSVKIDRRFVDPDSSAAPILLQLMVEAAHAHGLPVVVEGVEYEHQLTTLRELGCEGAQGYLLGRPGPLEDVVGQPVSAVRRVLMPEPD